MPLVPAFRALAVAQQARAPTGARAGFDQCAAAVLRRYSSPDWRRGHLVQWTTLRSTSSVASSKTWGSRWNRRPLCLPAGAKTIAWHVLSAASSDCATHTCTAQTVCRHWLRGLCMKGNACGFLHQFEASRMPVCRFFAKYNECKVRFWRHTRAALS